MESREEGGMLRDHGEEGRKKAGAKPVLSKDLDFRWFAWKGGKARTWQRAVTCSQDPEAEEDFQEELSCFLEEMKGKECPGVQNVRSRGGCGFGE